VLPPLLAAFAAFADSRGAHGLARDALLASVPFAAVGALVVFGDFVDARGEGRVGLQAFLSAAIVALLVLSCAVRSSAVHGVPPLGVSSLVAALGLFAIKGIVAMAPYARRLAELWPAKP
jgi:hypothetical protein